MIAAKQPQDSACPFPGMAPFLESRWSDLHTRMSTYASDALAELLPEGMVARLEEYVVLENKDGVEDRYRPDVGAFETNQTIETESAESTAMLQSAALPVLVTRRTEPETVRFVKVLESQSGKLVTAIEFLVRQNKIGRESEFFQTKQDAMLRAGVNIVEIDLLRQGRWVVSVPEEWTPASVSQPYRICAVRARRPRLAEMYPVSLREPLPTIRIPLRPDDTDVPLNLQDLFTMAYQRGGYANTNYSGEPIPELSPEDTAWADQILKAAGKRGNKDD